MDMVLTMTKTCIQRRWFPAVPPLNRPWPRADIKLTGNPDDLKQFLAYFEAPGADPISLTLH